MAIWSGGSGDYGTPLYELQDPDPPGPMEFAKIRALLDENMEPCSDVTWDLIKSQVQILGWSKEYLWLVATELLKKTWVQRGDAFPRWYIGEWWKPYGPRLYPRSWYQALTPAQQKGIEIYDAPGRGPMFAPAGTGAPFPRWDGTKLLQEQIEADRRLLPTGPSEIAPEVRSVIDITKRVLELEVQNEQLERRIAAQEEMLRGLRQRHDEAGRQADEMRRQRDNIGEWNLEMVALLESWAAAEREPEMEQLIAVHLQRDELLAELRPAPSTERQQQTS